MKDFHVLFEEHRQDMMRYALSLTKNKDKAEDLVQDVYVRAGQYFHTYDQTCLFRSWILRALKNVWIDSTTRNLVMVENEQVGFSTSIVDLAPSPDDNYSRQETIDYCVAEIKKLPQKWREVMSLLAEGYSYEEISSMLNIPMGSVRSRIYRARQKLAIRCEASGISV